MQLEISLLDIQLWRVLFWTFCGFFFFVFVGDLLSSVVVEPDDIVVRATLNV